MASARHHLHKRERIYKKFEKYPHPNKFKRLVDKLIYGIALFGPVVSIPQILKIYLYQNAAGVSLFTWIGYLIGSIFWIIYGALHKEKPIVFSSSLWIVIELLVIAGILIY
jgi:MtN3 and saliva related transmembrane protein